MNMFKKCLLALVLFSAGLSAADEPEAVALLDFSSPAKLNGVDKDRIREVISTTLGQGGFQVIERAKLAAVIKEQALTESGLTAGDETKLGKLLSANLMVAGTLDKSMQRWMISLRVVDVATGEIAGEDRLDVSEAKLEAELQAGVRALAKQVKLKRRKNVTADMVKDYMDDQEYELAMAAALRVQADIRSGKMDEPKFKTLYEKVLSRWSDARAKTVRELMDEKRLSRALFLVEGVLGVNKGDRTHLSLKKRINDLMKAEESQYRDDRIFKEQRAKDRRDSIQSDAIRGRERQIENYHAWKREVAFVETLTSSGFHLNLGYGFLLKDARPLTMGNCYGIQFYGIGGGTETFRLPSTYNFTIDFAPDANGKFLYFDAALGISPWIGGALKMGRVIGNLNIEGVVDVSTLAPLPLSSPSLIFRYGIAGTVNLDTHLSYHNPRLAWSLNFRWAFLRNAAGDWDQRVELHTGLKL